MTTLRVGERNRAWFKPGATDNPAGPYEVQFRSPAGVDTAWLPMTAGTIPAGLFTDLPAGGPGFYVWVATPDVAAPVAGDGILAPDPTRERTRYSSKMRYVSGRLIDTDTLGPIDVITT